MTTYNSGDIFTITINTTTSMIPPSFHLYIRDNLTGAITPLTPYPPYQNQDSSKEPRFDIILKPKYPKVLVQEKRPMSGKWR